MKVLIILMILISCMCVQAQQINLNPENYPQLKTEKKKTVPKFDQPNKQLITIETISIELKRKIGTPGFTKNEIGTERQDFLFLKTADNEEIQHEKIEDVDFRKIDFAEEPDKFLKEKNKEKFHWKPALEQSGIFLGIQHGVRLMQRKTQRELDGPFFRDWGNSVKNFRGWRDGDSVPVNYVAHPMQGATTGRIFVNNSDKSKKLVFGSSKDYWTSRMKAMAWSAVWSTQFEIGPISEATIGNVGIRDNVGRSGMAWVDVIMTPTAGTGVLIGEDMIDRYILKNWLEKKLTSRTKIKLYRTFFNPITSFVNVLGGKKPWNRYNR